AGAAPSGAAVASAVLVPTSPGAGGVAEAAAPPAGAAASVSAAPSAASLASRMPASAPAASAAPPLAPVVAPLTAGRGSSLACGGLSTRAVPSAPFAAIVASPDSAAPC